LYVTLPVAAAGVYANPDAMKKLSKFSFENYEILFPNRHSFSVLHFKFIEYPKEEGAEIIQSFIQDVHDQDRIRREAERQKK
jgi:hypothetical protein